MKRNLPGKPKKKKYKKPTGWGLINKKKIAGEQKNPPPKTRNQRGDGYCKGKGLGVHVTPQGEPNSY